MINSEGAERADGAPHPPLLRPSNRLFPQQSGGPLPEQFTAYFYLTFLASSLLQIRACHSGSTSTRCLSLHTATLAALI